MKSKILIVLIGVAVIAIITFIFVSVFKTKNELVIEHIDTSVIELWEEEFPKLDENIYPNKSREEGKDNDGDSFVKLNYEFDDDVAITQFIESLHANGFVDFELGEPEEEIILAKKAQKDGKMLVIYIQYDKDGAYVKYSIKDDTISDYDLSNYSDKKDYYDEDLGIYVHYNEETDEFEYDNNEYDESEYDEGEYEEEIIEDDEIVVELGDGSEFEGIDMGEEDNESE